MDFTDPLETKEHLPPPHAGRRGAEEPHDDPDEAARHDRYRGRGQARLRRRDPDPPDLQLGALHGIANQS